MKTELEAGPELDAAVAEACGIEGIIGGMGFLVMSDPTPKGSFGYVMWQPSTDLNDAFEAAEKVGLFEKHYLFKRGDAWCVTDLPAAAEWLDCSGPTPAVAICRAILKVKATTTTD